MSNPIEIEIVNPNVPTHNLQTKIVTPSKETQVITADEGYYGLREVIVSPPVIDIDILANEINSMKESLTDGNATPNDIKLGKTAYVKGQKVVGSFEISGTLDVTEDGEYDVSDYANVNIKTGSKLKKLLDYTKSARNLFSSNKNVIDVTEYIVYEDTSNVTNMSAMFYDSPNLITIPPLDVSNVTNMSYMFAYCYSLTTIPLLDTSNVKNMEQMFYHCNSLTTIPLLDMRNATNVNQIFINCQKLINLTILNIKLNLQVGSSSSYGQLLTLESLIRLCQECINVNASRKLTVGSANITKLADVYVKLTGEAEEDETLPKIPMVQCESTDEGAMLIKDYMALKSWTLA